jgi:hypothetical protein
MWMINRSRGAEPHGEMEHDQSPSAVDRRIRQPSRNSKRKWTCGRLNLWDVLDLNSGLVELYRISLVIAGWAPSEQPVDPNQLRRQQPEAPNGLAC